jgi:hypothetical protein
MNKENEKIIELERKIKELEEKEKNKPNKFIDLLKKKVFFLMRLIILIINRDDRPRTFNFTVSNIDFKSRTR